MYCYTQTPMPHRHPCTSAEQPARQQRATGPRGAKPGGGGCPKRWARPFPQKTQPSCLSNGPKALTWRRPLGRPATRHIDQGAIPGISALNLVDQVNDGTARVPDPRLIDRRRVYLALIRSTEVKEAHPDASGFENSPTQRPGARAHGSPARLQN